MPSWHLPHHRPRHLACLALILIVSALTAHARGAEVPAATNAVALGSRPPVEADTPAYQLEVLLLAWNEAHLLPYTVRFFHTRFPPGTVRITVYDNESTDGTRELAVKLGCQVRDRKTGGSLSVSGGKVLRNMAWKNSTADWVLISDMDEWVDIWPDRLAAYEVAGVTAVKARGAYLVWPNDTLDLSQEPRGVWEDSAMDASYRIPLVHVFDKPALYYRSAIDETDIDVGGHTAHPTGRIKWLHETPIPAPVLFHVKYFDTSTFSARFAQYRPRMTQENIRRNWGAQYMHTDNSTIVAQFAHMRQISRPLPWRVF